MRVDIPSRHKKWIVSQAKQDPRPTFGALQKAFYIRTRGLYILQTNNQLKRWGNRDWSHVLGKTKRGVGGSNTAAEPSAKECAEWVKAMRLQHLPVNMAMVRRHHFALTQKARPRWWWQRWRHAFDFVTRSVQRRTTKSVPQLLALLQSLHGS